MNDPNNLKLIDAGGWGQDGYIKNFEVNDKLMAYRVDATRSFADGWISDIQFGYNYTTRDKDKSSVESRLCFVSCAGVGDSAPYPGSPSSFDFGGLSGLATYNAEDLLKDGTYVLQQKFDKDIANKNWTISEDVSTWYAQVNIDTEVGDNSLRGNFGFQYVNTDQSSTGYSSYAGNPAGTPTSGGDSYGEFLPSLNLSLGMAHEQYLRFAAAKQMARPRMDWMRASYDVGISTNGCNGQDVPPPPNTAQWCGGGGNPQLKPWLANAYDLSYEIVFHRRQRRQGIPVGCLLLQATDQLRVRGNHPARLRWRARCRRSHPARSGTDLSGNYPGLSQAAVQRRGRPAQGPGADDLGSV